MKNIKKITSRELKEANTSSTDAESLIQNIDSGGMLHKRYDGVKKASIYPKIAIIVLILLVAGYIVYHKSIVGRVNLYLANQPINSSSRIMQNSFIINQPVYFFLERSRLNLEASQTVVEIEYFEGKDYVHHKQITFETDKNYPNIGGSIPSVYFLKSGKYRINVLLDGKEVYSYNITLTE